MPNTQLCVCCSWSSYWVVQKNWLATPTHQLNLNIIWIQWSENSLWYKHMLPSQVLFYDCFIMLSHSIGTICIYLFSSACKTCFLWFRWFTRSMCMLTCGSVLIYNHTWCTHIVQDDWNIYILVPEEKWSDLGICV